MASTGKAEARSNSVEAEQAFRQDVELREEERLAGERVQQQQLNQGMDTGTHSSSHLGVDWSPAFSVKPEVEEGPTKKQIEARAYELYLQRGCKDGHDVEDWLAAEKELKQS